jgi:hypothetical protein
VAVSFRISDPRQTAVRLVNLRSGHTEDLPIAGLAPGDVPASRMAFAADGTLYIAGEGGIRRCDVSTKTCTTFRAANTAHLAISRNRRFLVGALYKQKRAMAASGGDLVLFDLQNGTQRKVSGFGSDVMSIAINHDGTVIATSRTGGVLTIGAPTGHRRYVIPGAGGSPAISPDGKWLLVHANIPSPQIRIYPMPDLSRPPLHTLPHDELMARLDEMTNLRAVPDEKSDSGYKLEAGPFPGWRKQPRWQ